MGEAAHMPAKNRVIIIVWRSFAVAVPMVKMLYKTTPAVIGQRRPASSDAGAHKVGPAENPKTYRVTPSVVTSVLTPKYSLVEPTVAENIALAKEETKVT